MIKSKNRGRDSDVGFSFFFLSVCMGKRGIKEVSEVDRNERRGERQK